MSEKQVPTLEIPLNPVNLRHGAQYRSWGVPFLPAGAEQKSLDKIEDYEQEFGSNTTSALRSEDDAESSIPILESPLNPVNLRQGSAYRGGQTPISQVQTEETELGEAEQNNQEVGGDTNKNGKNSEHTHRAQEWYTDDQISEFISYSHACLTSIPPRPLVTFYTISTHASPHPSPACSMLREASRAGLAQYVRSSDRIEVYSVGAPPPVRPVGLSEHWWSGLTPAQIRAGPLAGEREVRNAEKILQRDTQAKKERNRWLDEEREKTAEGVRRQEEGTSMSDDVDESQDG